MTMSICRRVLMSSLLVGCVVAVANPVSAQHRARLSRDLAAHLARGSQSIDVIVRGSRAEVDLLSGRYNVPVRRYIRAGAVLRLNAGQLAALREDAAVDRLSSDAPVRATADVTRETIGADQVWAGAGALRALSGAGVGVAVIDSGVDPAHAALARRVVASVDFTGGDGVDGYGHGTHVASLIAGAAGPAADTAGYQGIAPGARIISLRVLDASGAGQASSVIEAIDWAIANRRRYDIKVLNLSLGAPVTQSYVDDPLCEAAQRAVDAGLVVVAAAGNFGITEDGKRIFGGITAPGNAPSVITVGALDTKGTAVRSDDGIAKFSSRGPTLFDHVIKPDLVAPGRNVIAAEAAGSALAARYPERRVAPGYISLSGSSMSAGVVSGAVALLLERRPNLRPADVRAVLQLTSEFLTGEGLVAAGAGSLNALAAAQFTVSSNRMLLLAVLRSETLASFSERPSQTVSRLVAASAQEKAGDTIIWGQGSTIIWGQAATIIWGQNSTIIWGQNSTIIWGQSALNDTIIWGQIGSDTIIWGQDSSDTIIWGQTAPDTIIWGQSSGTDTIIWGQGGSDTIIWGQNASDTIIWGQDGSDTIIWGQDSPDTIIWGQ